MSRSQKQRERTIFKSSFLPGRALETTLKTSEELKLYTRFECSFPSPAIDQSVYVSKTTLETSVVSRDFFNIVNIIGDVVVLENFTDQIRAQKNELVFNIQGSTQIRL